MSDVVTYESRLAAKLAERFEAEAQAGAMSLLNQPAPDYANYRAKQGYCLGLMRAFGIIREIEAEMAAETRPEQKEDVPRRSVPNYEG